jgi:hypothetical protein
MEIKDYDNRISQLVMQGNFTELQVLLNEIGTAIIAMDNESAAIKTRLDELGEKSGQLGALRAKTQQLLLQVNAAITNFQAPVELTIEVPALAPAVVPAPVPAEIPAIVPPEAVPAPVVAIPPEMPEAAPVAQTPGTAATPFNIDDLLESMGDTAKTPDRSIVADSPAQAPVATPPVGTSPATGTGINLDDILKDISDEPASGNKPDDSDLEKMLNELSI